jgi:energy-converting hydrogenase Eha subunit F
MKEKLNHIYAILTRTELWLSVVVVLSAIYQANILPPESAMMKIIALALAVLSALGYTVARTMRKNAKGTQPIDKNA